MGDLILATMLVISLAGTALLYWRRVGEQARERRVRRRLAQIRHVSAVVRASLAEQRAA